jgi:F-type H+-transporting ATPase subunit gamma
MRAKIKTTTDIEKITSSMKMIAASKMGNDIKRMEASVPFSGIFERLAAPESEESESAPGKVMLIVNSSDRGLCGGINNGIAKASKIHGKAIEKKGGEVEVSLLGDKAKGKLKADYGTVFQHGFSNLAQPATFSSVCAMAENLVDADCDAFDLLHQHFVSQIAYEPMIRKMPNLNAARSWDGAGAIPDLTPAHLSDYEFEPECRAEALANLSELVLAGNIFCGSVDGTAAEQSSRRAAMDNASSNAADMVVKFTMQYNRLRQARITTELTEIVSGAEALNDEE